MRRGGGGQCTAAGGARESVELGAGKTQIGRGGAVEGGGGGGSWGLECVKEGVVTPVGAGVIGGKSRGLECVEVGVVIAVGVGVVGGAGNVAEVRARLWTREVSCLEPEGGGGGLNLAVLFCRWALLKNLVSSLSCSMGRRTP